MAGWLKYDALLLLLFSHSGVQLVQLDQPNSWTDRGQIQKNGWAKPLPFLRFFDGQGKYTFENQYDDGGTQIPKPRIVFDGNYSKNGYEAMCWENETRYDGFDGIYEGHCGADECGRVGGQPSTEKLWENWKGLEHIPPSSLGTPIYVQYILHM